MTYECQCGLEHETDRTDGELICDCGEIIVDLTCERYEREALEAWMREAV